MWTMILKSRLFSWLSAIASALAFVFVVWTSQRKVQSAEVKAEGAIALEKEKTQWNDEKAATAIVENNTQRDYANSSTVDALKAQSAVLSKDDSQVSEELANKWTRSDL